MTYELKLTLTFEGSDAGLENDRLRVDTFGPALVELQRAFRRIAQDLVRAAGSEREGAGGRRTGRFNRFVENLAWEIDTISHNSPVQIRLACPVPSVPIFNTLAMFAGETIDRAADELLSALESEATGAPRNVAVREYLATLPVGLHRQRYELVKLDGSSRHIELSDVDRVGLEAEYPHFILRTGQVVGVHFPPAAPEVRFLLADSNVSFTAASDDTELAVEHRSQTMTGLFLRKGRRHKALWLEPGSGKPSVPTREERDEYFRRRWGPALKALAQ